MSTTTPPTTTTTSSNVVQYVAASVTLVTVVGLIVLLALGKISAADGLPLIGVLAGVHGGATLTNAATK